MNWLTELIKQINSFVWGIPMLVMILGVGLFLTLGLRGLQVRKLVTSFRLLWKGRRSDEESKKEGEISPFSALMTSLSATIGTGNIAGVATAIFLGGPGALFWMWCTALVGMATKYSEAVCAVKFRERDDKGDHVGGPMYYIKNGLGKRWAWLGALFALFGSIAGFGIGNTVQANSVSHALESSFGIPLWVSGLITMLLVGSVIIGGVKRIAQVASRLVPLMALLYLAGGLIVLIANYSAIPEAFWLILHSAFNPVAASGGFAGAGVAAAIQFGVARGVFSNEAGLGSAPIAHAVAQTNEPVKQGLIAMLGTFLDTLVICSITGLAIVVSGAWNSGETGSVLTAHAFSSTLPGVGGYVVAIALAIFAFTTILGWSFYGEKCVQYLLGDKAILPFRLLWICAIPVGATGSLSFIWLLADTLNAMMAIPNLIALVLLSPVVFHTTREYFAFKALERAVASCPHKH
ncbi:alanine/glycine:cation symporter family protein [Dongshaea marina]|uniref:alanine/glycine:cation symporter family protein n=1 Tax=Dongshaea marina TaxID=2047966 RepID=UPI000D3E5B3D|nr:sodium:alanine symporter family protein [Dongshaea marina]